MRIEFVLLGLSLLVAGCGSSESPSPEAADKPAGFVSEPAPAKPSEEGQQKIVPAEPASSSGLTDNLTALKMRLLAMAGTDQEIRKNVFSKPAGQITSEDRAQLEAIDKSNSDALGEILATRGWPGKTLVGEEAANAAFLIVQHGDRDLQKRALPLLEDAYRKGEASGEQLALLTDRVRVNDGKPQLYGTQALMQGGKLKVEPIEDEAKVDERRAQLGLPPLAEYLAELRKAYPQN